jgi:hypothetical protein
MLREQFEEILSEFGKTIGLELSLLDDAVSWMVDDEVLVNLQYLDASDYLLLWTQVGPLGEGHAMELLRLNEVGGDAAGFTLSLDEANALVLAHDRRSAWVISSADALAEWTEALIRCTRAARAIMGNHSSAEGELCRIMV